MYDAHSNFGFSLIASAPSPATTGLSLAVTSGEGSLFPAVPFNAVVWPPGIAPLASNAEIVRVTGIAGSVLTIVRAQEVTTAKSISVGWQIAAAITAKLLQDIEAAVNALAPLAGNGSPEAVVSAAPGRLYQQQDGARALWSKSTGSGNTGWIRQARSQAGAGNPEGVVLGSPGDSWLNTSSDEQFRKKTGIDTSTGWI